jgi:hypothetical protein
MMVDSVPLRQSIHRHKFRRFANVWNISSTYSCIFSRHALQTTRS